MIKNVLTAILWTVVILSQGQPARIPRPKQIVITGVTVIDATGAAPATNMTVLISGDRITMIAPGEKIQAPRDAQVVRADGMFLIPGLWDMHVHWYQKDYLPLFIANGVTGVRQMWGMPLHHIWRREIEAGSLLGPRMIIASPIIDGPNPVWEASVSVRNDVEARQAVNKARRDGADFIKVYSRLTRDGFFAIADESRKLGIPFAGHVPQSVTVAEASDAGQKSIEHLTGLLLACSSEEDQLSKDYASLASRPDLVQSRRITRLSLNSYSEEKAAALFNRFKKNQTWQCPTLTVLRSGAFMVDSSFRNDPRLKYLPMSVKGRWDPTTDFRFKNRTREDFDLAKTVFKKQQSIVVAMRRAGVDVIAGTDVLNPFCFPGFSLHDELALLVESGFSPLEALQAATVNAARYQGKEKELGTVEVGKIADLVLLEANPLANIENTKKINSVIIGGRLINKAEILRMLQKIESLAEGK